jgi:maltose O-acetyltransferase
VSELPRPQSPPPGTSRDGAPSGPAQKVYRNGWDKFRRIVAEELGTLHPRVLLASLLVKPLPRHALCRARTTMYRLAGVKIGAGTLVLDELVMSGEGEVIPRLTIGRGCVINGPLYLDLNDEVTIGDGVSIGNHTTFITAGHATGHEWFRAGALTPAPIRIESGCLIGARCTVLPGVTIGRGCVIAAGSLVATDIPPNKLAAGSPARVLKSLPEDP